MKGARVWGWGDDLELAGKNAQTYINKRWKSTTEECSVVIDGRNLSKDILFKIIVYINEPEGVEGLVNDLLDVVLTGEKGNKIYFVTVNLYDHLASNKRTYRNDLSFVKEAHEKQRLILIQKFKKHPEVEPLLREGRTLEVFSPIAVYCELKSERFNKVIVWMKNYDLDPLLDHMHVFANKLIELKIATRILGYDLGDNIEELAIEDLDVTEKEVCLWLA